MDILKQVFPFAFKVKEKNVTDLVVSIIIHLVAGALGGIILFILGKLPFVGFLFGIVGGVVELYVLVGIVLAVLNFCNVLKN